MADNIVETIFVKLGLDSSGFTQPAERAVKTNEKLNESVKKTDKVTGTAAKTMAKWFSAIAVSTGLAKLIDNVQKLNDELYHLEKNLGMSSTTIKAWQNAAGAMGGSADGMTNSMKSLNGQMNDFVVMGDTSLLPFMNALGVSMIDANGKLRDTDKVMLDLADSFSKMDREQAFSLASKMGIDEGTFNTLVQGRQEMEKMIEYQKTMYQSSEKELQASRNLAKNRALLAQHWQSLQMMMANIIIPVFEKLSKVALGIFEYLQKHQREVKVVFTSIAAAISLALIPALVKATVAALAFIAPFAPFILVVTALGAAFGLLYDDYKTWAEGGESLFNWGAFSGYIEKATVNVDNLKKGFAYLLTGYTDWAVAAENGKSWLKLKGFIDENGVSLNSLRKGFVNLADDMMSTVIPTLKGYASIIQKVFNGDFGGAVAEAREMGGSLWDRIKSAGSAIGDRFSGAADVATGQAIGTASAVDVLGVSSNNLEAKSGKGVKAEFVQKYLPVAKQVGAQLGVPPEALLGQWALETGWGRSITKGTGFNLGNIKAGSSWKGATVRAYDKAEKSNDKYRVYNTADEFANDYVKLIKGRKGYAKAVGAKTPEAYFTGLKQGGYATDPKYVQSGVAVTNAVKGQLISANATMSQAAISQSALPPSKAKASGSTTKNDVTIGNINVNTTSSTVTGTVTDALNAAKNQAGMLLGSAH